MKPNRAFASLPIGQLAVLTVLLGVVFAAQYLPPTQFDAAGADLGAPVELLAYSTLSLFAGMAVAIRCRSARMAPRRYVASLLVVLGVGLGLLALAPSGIAFVALAFVVGIGNGAWAGIQQAVDSLVRDRSDALPLGMVVGIGAFFVVAALRSSGVAVADWLGWRAGLASLAAVALIGAAVAVRSMHATRPHGERAVTRSAPSRLKRRDLVGGALTIGLTSLVLAPLEQFETVAMKQAHLSTAISVLSVAFPLGMAIAAIGLRCVRREPTAMVIAAVVALSSVLAGLVNTVIVPAQHQHVGFFVERLLAEAGTGAITFTLAAMYAKRFGQAQRITSAFFAAKAICSSVGFVASPQLWAACGWIGALSGAIAAGAALVLAALRSARVLRRVDAAAARAHGAATASVLHEPRWRLEHWGLGHEVAARLQGRALDEALRVWLSQRSTEVYVLSDPAGRLHAVGAHELAA